MYYSSVGTLYILRFSLRDRVLALETQTAVASGPRPSVFKANLPPEFDGSRESGEAFANRMPPLPPTPVRNHHLCGNKDQMDPLVHDIGSGPDLRDSAITHHAATRSYVWISVKAFHGCFPATNSTRVAEAEAAMVKLENSEYFQRSGESVDAYVDRFRALVKKAKLGDKGAVIIKFRHGLAKSLHTTLSDSPFPPFYFRR